MKTKFARREFLAQAAKGLGFLAASPIVYESFLSQFVQKAYAQTIPNAVSTTGCYVHISMPGGPPRWFYDLPLTPYGQTPTNFVAGGFGTILEKSGSLAIPKYEARRVQSKNGGFVKDGSGADLYLPPVWGMSTTNQDFTDLLRHTVFVRGLDMEINNHPLSNRRQVAPVIGGASISGVMSDKSNLPIPAIIDTQADASNAFRSNQGYSAAPIDFTNNATRNPALSMLSPFKDFKTGKAVHRADREALQEQALAEFERGAQERGVTSTAAVKMYENAMTLVDQGLISIGSQSNWSAVFNKYKMIIETAIRPAKGTLNGIYDQSIGVPVDNVTYKYNRNAKLTTANLTDARDVIGETTTIARMAENFALTELLIDKASSSFTLSMPAMSNLYSSAKGRWSMTHDQHDIGSVVSTLVTTLYYRAFIGCLTEFVTALKTKGIFDKTVIHVSAEFNRTPLKSGAGSDHAFMGASCSIISGMLNQTEVIGNVKKDHYNDTYHGTFGVAADYAMGGLTRPIQVNDVALTITSMLGLGNIVTNGRSLLLPEGNLWKVGKREAKNV